MDIQIIYESSSTKPSREAGKHNADVAAQPNFSRSIGGKRKCEVVEEKDNSLTSLVPTWTNKKLFPVKPSNCDEKKLPRKTEPISQAEINAEVDYLVRENPFADVFSEAHAPLQNDIVPDNDPVSHDGFFRLPNSCESGNVASLIGVAGRNASTEPVKRDAFSLMMQQSKQFYSYSAESNQPELTKSAGSANVLPKKKYCPFYKKMPFTSSAVDAFKYGTIPNINAYFLSHFHSDHYGGMTSNFVLKHHVYASKITANLIKLRICTKATPETLHVLPSPGQSTVVDCMRITTFDANHCPGALVILFELPNGKKYVHCGDFRADPTVFSQPQYKQLENIRPDSLYLDTTYLDPKYDFLPQAQVLAFAGRLAHRLHAEEAATLFLCGSYSIGKERVFMSMAEAIQSKVFCYSLLKLSTLHALEWPELDALLVRDGNKAKIHVVPMGMIQLPTLEKYLKTYERRFTRIVAIKPTGWTHRASSNGDEASLDKTKPIRSGRVTIYNIPYSEHSSFSELEWFVKFVKPQRIVPTVNLYSAESRRKMNVHLCRWLAEAGAPQRTTSLIDADIVSEADSQDARSTCSSRQSSYMEPSEFDDDLGKDDDI